MTAPNEQFALELLQYLDADLVKDSRPNWIIGDQFETRAGSSELALYWWAYNEWTGMPRSLADVFSKLDRQTLQDVILILEHIYLLPLKENSSGRGLLHGGRGSSRRIRLHRQDPNIPTTKGKLNWILTKPLSAAT